MAKLQSNPAFKYSWLHTHYLDDDGKVRNRMKNKIVTPLKNIYPTLYKYHHNSGHNLKGWGIFKMIQEDCLQIQRSVAIAFDQSIFCPQCSCLESSDQSDSPNDDDPNGDDPNGDSSNGGGPNDGDPTADSPNGDNPNGDIPNGDVPNGDSPIRISSQATETSIIEFAPPKPIHRSKTHIALSQEFEQRILSVSGVLDFSQPSKNRIKSECVGMSPNELKMILTEKKPVGIKNRMNMCYFISSIIMLMNIEPLWDFIVKRISSLPKDDRLTKYMSMALLSMEMHVYMKDQHIDLNLFKDALEKITRETIRGLILRP